MVKEALILSNDYNLSINDFSADELKIEVDLNTNPVSLGGLTTSEQKLCHVVVNLTNPMNSGLIDFDALNMQSKSLYYDKSDNNLHLFENILTGQGWNYAFMDISFSPPVVNGGKGEVLTINATGGTNFGTNKGNVLMRDAEKGGIGTQMFKIEDKYVTWNANSIQVIIPQLSEFAPRGYIFTPGSGPVQIETVDGTGTVISTITSPNQVEIFYSIANILQVGSASTKPVIVCQTELDTTGGITFHLGADVDSIPNARAIIEESLCIWKEKTGVNYNLSDFVIQNPEQNGFDNINTILLVDDEDFLMRTFVKEGGFTSSSLGQINWVKDVDIVISQITKLQPYTLRNWNYSFNPPAPNEVDFYTAITHEFGHAHSLAHVTSPSPDTVGEKLMYIFTNPGDNRRTIDTTAILGGKFILNFSDTLNSLPPVINPQPIPMTPILNFNCITSTHETKERKIIPIVLYPNPFDDFIQINYTLSEPSEVDLLIYDVTGKILKTAQLGRQGIGEQLTHIEFNPSAGIYFVRLQTGYGFETLKIIKH